MENITDALKMAAAALIFIVAFSITMAMFTQARQTTDKVIRSTNLSQYLPKVDPLEGKNVTRIVGIETVIPTIYRYGQQDETLRIRILADDGKTELQIFDKEIEDLAPFDQYTDQNDPNYPRYQKLEKLYGMSSNKPACLFGAPWQNQNSIYYVDRINSYIYGKKSKYFEKVDYSTQRHNGEPISLIHYKDRKFEETYIEYRMVGGEVFIDEYGEEIVTKPAKTKIIITYRILPIS